MPADTNRLARSRAIIAALLAALCVLAGTSSASAAAPRSFFGVMPQTNLQTSDIDRMGQAKVGTLRFSIDWASVDPTSAPNDYNFGGVDAQVRDAAKNGIRVLPYLVGTPGWVAAMDGDHCPVATNQCGAFAPHGSAAIAAFKTFAADVVRRYGPNGIFWQQNPSLPQKPIRAWQIWNEQNSPSFYAPKPNVARYAKLLAAGNSAIKSVDPGAEVIVGGMFGTPLGGRKPGIAAWDFLAKLYDVKGSKKTFDGVAIHPYAAKLSKVQSQVDLMRDSMKAAHDTATDIWITELGWASSGPRNPLVRGNKGQAESLTDAFDYFASKRRAYHIQTVIWYSWQDNPDPDVGLCEWCPGSGLLTKSGKEKPAFDAFVGYTGGS
jgi:Glycosyl hydrolase catalytic core